MKILALFSLMLVGISVLAQDAIDLDKLFIEGQYEKVIEHGKIRLQKEPDNGMLSSIIGRSLTELGKFDEAKTYLLKSASDNDVPDWAKAWSLSSLGVCYYFTEEFEAAKECFRIVVEMNATQNVTRDATRKMKFLQLSEKFDSWTLLETEHFRFHIQSKDSIADVNRFVREREKAFSDLNSFFNAQLPKKIDFYVWENTDEAFLFFKKELGFAMEHFCIINVSKHQTRGHEIAHVLLGWGFKPTFACAFINEGAATFFDHTNRNRLDRIKDEKLDADFDFVKLWENPNQYPSQLNYTVGAAWIEYLVRKGTVEQLKQLLANQSVENARKVYEDFDNMADEFNRFLQLESN